MDKVTMTQETRDILTGLAPFSINSTLEYVPEAYQTKNEETGAYLVPKELWPTFKIRPWSRKETNDAVKILMKFGDTTDDTGTRDIVRKAVTGWENLLDVGSDTLVDFVAESDGGAKKELFDCFPLSLVLDLSHKIGNISGINKSEKLGLKS